MVLNAILEFFSLASFLPVIFLLVNPEIISSNPAMNAAYNFFGARSASIFVAELTGCVLAFVLVKSLISLWITRRKAGYAYETGSNISSRMLSRYTEISFLEFTQKDYARELNRIASIPFAFANNIILPIATFFSEGIVFFLLLSCVIAYDYKIFLFLAIVTFPIGCIYWLKRRKIRRTSEDLKEKYPRSLKYALQVVEGLSDIRVFGKESFFKNRFDTISKSLSMTFAGDHVLQTGVSRLAEVIAATVICSLIIYSALISRDYHETLILLSIYAAASFRIIPSLNRLLNASLQIKTHEYLFRELTDVMHYRPATVHSPSPSISFTKTIELKDVTFRYPDGRPVLNGISFTLNKGDKIALVGRSGSGKTTFLLVLLQLLDDHEGTVSIDGVRIHPKQTGWHSLFSYVPQNPYMLDGTILENIAFGLPPSEVNRKKIGRLLADLDLMAMIDQLPQGLETPVGERGIKLSGGQRQRIAIARALYGDAEVLLLDEITNQLDAQTEQEVLKTLENITRQNKTIIMITHRTNFLAQFTRLIRLDNGTFYEESAAKTSQGK